MDVIPVIIGILLALSIQSFQTEKENKKFAESVLVSIAEEMEENTNSLKTKILEHKQLLDTLDVHFNNKESSIGLIINQSNGVGFVGLKNTAWMSLMNSKMGLVDFKYISILSNIDDGKKYMHINIEKITDLIFNKIESSDYEDKRLLLILIENLLSLEKDLLESHLDFFEVNVNQKST